MWLHNMNGGSGGGGGIFVLFLLVYFVTYCAIGAKIGGFKGAVVTVILSIGLPLLLDSGSDWFPLGAFAYMFFAWVITIPIWVIYAIVMRLGGNLRKADSSDEDSNDKNETASQP